MDMNEGDEKDQDRVYRTLTKRHLLFLQFPQKTPSSMGWGVSFLPISPPPFVSNFHPVPTKRRSIIKGNLTMLTLY